MKNNQKIIKLETNFEKALSMSTEDFFSDRERNKNLSCFECVGKLDQCCMVNKIESGDGKMYGFLCCKCKEENDQLDNELA